VVLDLLWWQEVGGWLVIIGGLGWLVVSLGLAFFGRRKTQDLKTGKVSKAWWYARNKRKKPPGPFLRS
jgi:hypothetical protein